MKRTIFRNLFNNSTKFCHHAHIDKSNIINNNNLHLATTHMKDKWIHMRDIKKSYTNEELYSRMNTTITNIVKQNCNHIRTFIDVDNIVNLKCIHIANIVKRQWAKNNVTIQLATQPLEGLETDDNIKLFEDAVKMVDIVGCLPSRDKNFHKHLDIAFSTAKKHNKHIEAHLDQCNVPIENETEIFTDFVDKYNYQNKARAIHSVSLACKSLEKQNNIAKKMAELNIGVIVCPSAAISMVQENKFLTPIHNSIAPVQVLINNGVDVALGIDNIHDIFMPFCDGDIIFELRLLSEATRIYDPEILKKILSNNLGF